MSDWTVITIEEFEANSNAILERTEAGEQFKVSRNGIVTMRVIPVADHVDRLPNQSE
jgi:antitoxin (DNA-binding transcriptional repressor) of toxin-antitoxin stability system